MQGAMRKVLDQIYEGKFYNFSYGFREGKSCHQAIREVNQLIMTKIEPAASRRVLALAVRLVLASSFDSWLIHC